MQRRFDCTAFSFLMCMVAADNQIGHTRCDKTSKVHVKRNNIYDGSHFFYGNMASAQTLGRLLSMSLTSVAPDQPCICGHVKTASALFSVALLPRQLYWLGSFPASWCLARCCFSSNTETGACGCSSTSPGTSSFGWRDAAVTNVSFCGYEYTHTHVGVCM